MKTYWVRCCSAAAGLAALGLGGAAQAREFRVTMLPNGSVFRCANCHVNPAGGGTRTPFGQDVFAIVGGSGAPTPFWSATLAKKDSDGDGLTNGQELGDGNGTGTATPGAVVTNPGNRPPAFTSTPPLQAAMGLPYQYTATASDNEGNSVAFAKASGPSWLNVSTGGSVAGTPPDGSAGAFPVALKVSDLATATKGASGGSSTQLFTVTVISSLAGWQKFHFNLPAEAALADPLADPNGNGIPNLVEYAFRLDPRSTTGPGLPHVLPAFDAAGRMRLAVSVRDDDPKLEIVLEAAPTLSFANSNLVAGVASDPVPGDGLHTLTFTDPAARADSPTRFGRLRVWILP